MDYSEIIVLFASIFFTYRFFFRWYRYVSRNMRLIQNESLRTLLYIFPAIPLIIILYTLINLASFDVTGSGLWIIFYLLIGYMWLNFSMFVMFFFFDLSWIDDAINMVNPAAAIAIIGGGLGVTVIYSGANVGDGPGWWCVFLAGGLGLCSWIILGVLVNAFTGVFRKITVGRDVPCAIRTGAYLLSGGIILGRASAGDWTSFSQTVLEFGDGWPVIILTCIFILLEIASHTSVKQDRQSKDARLYYSLLLGVIYIAAAILTLYLLPPLPINPMYGR